jgi:hypothetical protein
LSTPTTTSTPGTPIVIRTDGMGAARSVEARAGVEVPPTTALAIDLTAAAVTRAGELSNYGGLRSALLVFEGGVIAIAGDEREGSVAVVGEPHVLPGLVLGHLHRVLTGADGEQP